MHEDILVPLKMRKDEAVVIARELKDLAEELERKKQELAQKAQTKRPWAMFLRVVPVVDGIGGPILSASADSDLGKAIAAGTQAKVQEAAAITVSKILIPALEAFIDGIEKLPAFSPLWSRNYASLKAKPRKARKIQSFFTTK